MLYAGHCRGWNRVKDIRNMLLCGADKVSLNTAAILNPDRLMSHPKNLGTNV